MRVALSSVVCLLLVVSFGSLTYGKCESGTPEEGASAKPKAEYFHQFFHKNCQTEQNLKYRTADGSCNNMFNYGSANTPFTRILPPAYGDNSNSPRECGKDGNPLPAATDVSRMILPDKDVTGDRTTMFMQWGQFIDHDITLTKSGESVKCCGENGTYPDQELSAGCFPIKLSEDDANERFEGNCMEFTRSFGSISKRGKQKYREQVNGITSFIDGSMIYGSSKALQKQLREGAKMKTSGENLLPMNAGGGCMHRDEDYCFEAGDVRVNVQPGLIAIHTMWVRLHNQIVDELKLRRPEDSLEEVFQEARKIVIGILQNIHYGEWLPLVIGNKTQELYQLTPGVGRGDRVGYSSKVDPTLFNSFSTAAFRFGHSTIPKHLVVSDTPHDLHNLFNRPDLVFDDFDGVVKALVDDQEHSRAQKTDKNMVEEITGHLFEPHDQKEEDPSRGFDLAAFNIQRGRDHGLLPFNKFRKICGLSPIEDFSEFGDDVKEKLSSLYSSVDDLDLFVGGLLEKHDDDAEVGPTFACIIAEQFYALKYGDRFYFETNRMPEGFTDEQLEAIRKVTFAHVCCKTSGISNVQDNVFLAREQTQSCADLKDNFLNLDLWQKF